MFAPLVAQTSVVFVSAASVAADGKGPVPGYGLRKRIEPVRGCRRIGKRDMRYNDATPRMRVDPETYVVEADGKVCAADPAESLPLTQQWFVY